MKTKTTNVIERMLAPLGKMLNPEAAERVANYQLDPVARRRIGVLARKANQGVITDSEQSEYDSIVNLLDFIAILQCEARALLRQAVR